MPVYQYIAKDSSGKIIKGSQPAESKTQVYVILKQKGLNISSINEQGFSLGTSMLSINIGGRVKVKDIALFCRQFSTILRAGVPMLRCLDILRKQTTNKKLADTLDKVYEAIQKGSVLSEAMSQHKDIFPSILINMVEAGELSGTLDNSLEKMAVHFEKDFKIRNKVKSAATYPAIICVIAVIAVMILLTVVVPQFSSMFESLGSKLPATTQMLLDSGNFMRSYWFLVLLLMAGIFAGFISFKKTDYGRRMLDELYFKIPFVSNLVVKVISSRFTRTMGTILGSGVPLIAALDVAEKIVGNTVAMDAVKKIREDVIRGEGLAKPLIKTGLFPVMVGQMISIGEETGSIDKMLEKTADFYDDEVDAAITQLTTMMEPAILIIMAGVVGFIVLSIVQPMFSIFGSIR